MSKIKEKIITAFDAAGIPISSSAAEKLEIYCQFLIQYNEKVNLTAITDIDGIISSHFIDSATGASLKEIPENAKCADVGTGAGFPGVVLAIMRQDITVALVDALKKRLVFLDELKEKIGIDNVYTVHSRSEDLGNSAFRESFDCVFSRAVARMNVLCEYDLPLVKTGGYMLAWKGPAATEELEESVNAIKILGGEQAKVYSCNNNGCEHCIIAVKKVKNTPHKYPRQAGTARKKPL